MSLFIFISLSLPYDYNKLSLFAMIREEGDYTKVRQKHQIKLTITPLKSSIQHWSKVELKLLCNLVL